MKKQNNTAILDFEQCEQIGMRTEDTIFNNVVIKINEKHPVVTGLSFFDQLSIDCTQSEDILSEANPDAYKELIALMKDEYRVLDELEQHCLFLYLFTSDNNEDEIIESMIWHLEEWMEERAYSFLNQAKEKMGLKN